MDPQQNTFCLISNAVSQLSIPKEGFTTGKIKKLSVSKSSVKQNLKETLFSLKPLISWIFNLKTFNFLSTIDFQLVLHQWAVFSVNKSSNLLIIE